MCATHHTENYIFFFFRSRNCVILCNKQLISSGNIGDFYGAAGAFVTGNTAQT
ncbi:hypothetical protein GHT06_008057 [Daphnia sinensis]|uniref:Uncharacterized protein n=1 Tax=Daphnia sinensis TaxID=1820382 RepID=A0AAD5L0K8_9CRUS|nr:hypothetical protein GHT06_008057 [Daphnia sinensis]